MNEHILKHMYQAWQQDNDNYRRDWSIFVLKAASTFGTTGDEIMRILQTCNWFHWIPEEK